MVSYIPLNQILLQHLIFQLLRKLHAFPLILQKRFYDFHFTPTKLQQINFSVHIHVRSEDLNSYKITWYLISCVKMLLRSCKNSIMKHNCEQEKIKQHPIKGEYNQQETKRRKFSRKTNPCYKQAKSNCCQLIQFEQRYLIRAIFTTSIDTYSTICYQGLHYVTHLENTDFHI